jgi:hypothetical protein
MTKPRHPEHRRLTERYGGSSDPDDLNLPVISGRISKLARRRALGKAGLAKSRGPTPARRRRLPPDHLDME